MSYFLMIFYFYTLNFCLDFLKFLKKLWDLPIIIRTTYDIEFLGAFCRI